MSYYRGKRVLVTGGAGFIGSFVVEQLLERGARVRVGVRSKEDLTHLAAVRGDVELAKGDCLEPADCAKLCRGQEVVLNLAAKVGGVTYNSAHQAALLRDNFLLASNMLEAAAARGVGRFLVVSSACVYARTAPVPTKETEGFVARPEATNEGYGWAKRMAEFLGEVYHREKRLEVAIARPYNAYGPRDHFGSKDSHVIPGLITRALAGEDPFVIWGTGKPTRSFLYVEDAARGLLEVCERWPKADPINLGTDEETSIGDVARLILKLCGSRAKVTFDTTKPLGQPRRACDTKKAAKLAGFKARVPLEEGLRRTIDWCKRTLR